MHLKLTYPVQARGRFFSKSSVKGYRFGFNGKEKVDEVYGDANAYDFGARIYDPRLGRWLSSDKMFYLSPGWSTYRAFYDNPNYWIDEDGNIEWPLKGSAVEYSHEHTKIPYRHYVKGNTKIGHIGQYYEFAFEETEESKKYKENLPRNDIQSEAHKKGMLVKINSEWFRIRDVGSSPHIGVDFRATVGTNVYSLGDGIVVGLETTNRPKTGRFIIIQYENGDKVRFLHMDALSKNIKLGDKVYEGQIIGQSGNTGGVPAHLHIDATSNEGKMVDPLTRSYGTISNAEFFSKYEGDWMKLKEAKEIKEKVNVFIENVKSRIKNK